MYIRDFEEKKEQSWFCDFLGYEIVIVLNIEPDEKIEGFSNLLDNVTKWDSSFFKKLEPMLYAYYKNTLLMCGETEPVIDSPESIVAICRYWVTKSFLT